MVTKKRSNKKARVRKEDEDIVNKRITIGAVLTLVFLMMFLVTQIQLREEKPFNIDELTPDEKIEYVRQQEQSQANIINYNKAITVGNRRYCDGITDTTLRNKCISETPEPSEEPEEPVEQLSPVQTSDRINYNKAITLGSTAYCAQIIDAELKADCYEDVQQSQEIQG